MDIKSHGSYWTVSDGNLTSYIIKERSSWKEILAVKRKIRLQERTVLRVSNSGLICFSCPSDQECEHRTALENHSKKQFNTDFKDPRSDIPGIRFSETVQLQPEHLSIRPPVRVGVNAATLACVADKVRPGNTVRLLLSPISGGPYSIFVTEEKGTSNLAQTVRGEVKNLAPGSVYYYVGQIVDSDGRILEESSEQVFQTLSHSPLTSRIGDLKLTSVTLFGTADNVSPDQEIILGWGEVGTGKISIAAKINGNGASGQLIQAELKNLVPNTNYWYTVSVTDHNSSEILQESDDRLFTTWNYSVSSEIVQVLGSSALIKATVDYVRSDWDIRLVYGKDTVVSTFKGTDQKGQTVVFSITNLTDETEYGYRIEIVHGDKVLYKTKTSKFTTKAFNITPHPTHDIKAGTAHLSGTADWVGKGEVLQIWVDGDLIASEPAQEKAGQIIKASLIDLRPVTRHEVKIAISNQDGIIKEATGTFETKTQNPCALGAVNIQDRTATVMGYIDFLPRQQFARFAWGTQSGEYKSFSQQLFGDDTEGQTFAIGIFPLQPETVYYYVIQIIGTDGQTVMDQSEEVEFVTSAQLRARRARDM